jgi:hypothetical protein
MIEMTDGTRPVNPDVYLDRPSAARPAPAAPPPGQAATNVALGNAQRAGSKVINLEAAQASGQDVTAAQTNSALQSYEQAQAKLLAAFEHELNASRAAAEPTSPATIFAGHTNSPEVAAVMALQKADASKSTDGKLNALLGALPKGVNPATAEFLMSDPAAQKIIGDYAKEAAGQIANTYKLYGARAAADQLQQIVAKNGSGAAGPQLAASIISQSMPTIKSMVGQLPLTKIVALSGPESRFGITQVEPDPAGQQDIVSDLAQVVEVAAAGSNPAASTYDTPQIQGAVTAVAQAMATAPAKDKLGSNLQAAAGRGYVTLGLATALQLRQSNQGAAANAMLGHVTAGIKEFQTYVNNTVTAVATSAAPLAAQGQYSQVLTNSEFTGGVSGLSNGVPASAKGPKVDQIAGVKKTVQQALGKVVQVGYNLVGVDQAVSFYQGTSLGSMPGYSSVTTARGNLMGGANSMAAELASPAAQDRVVGAILRAALPAKLQNGGTGAQHYSVTAQFVGDFTEFLAENYWTKGVTGGQSPGSLVLGDQILPAERVGHSPFALAWAGGGGAQLGLGAYVEQNVTLGGPLATQRKMLTLLIVGGFGGLHTGQAVAAGFRWAASQAGGGKVTPDTLIDKMSRLTVEPTVGLIRGLTVLMGLSTIADGAGVIYDGTGAQPFFNGASRGTDLGGHAVNLAADITLLRLQLRSWAQQSLGKTVLSDSTLSEQFSSQMSDAMLESLGVKVKTTASTAMRQAADQLFDTDPAFRKQAIDFLVGQLSPGGSESVSRAPKAVQAAVSLLQKYVGKLGGDGSTGLQRAWQRVGGVIERYFGKLSGASDESPDVAATLKALGGEFSKYLGNLTATQQRSLAAQWALDSNTSVDGASRFAKFFSSSKALDAFDKIPLPDILKSLLAKNGPSAGEDLPPGLAEALEQAMLPGGAAEGGADVAGEAALDWNPIGWVANTLYLGTTIANAAVSQVSTRDKFQAYEYAFLRGAGMEAPQAHAMASHNLWSGNDASSGLVQAYADLGGNPNDFIKYVDSMSVGELNKVLAGLSPLKEGTSLPKTAAQDYWSLPTNPNDAQQRQYAPGVTFNSSANRWEDKALGVYYSDGKWVKNGQSAVDGDYYDPTTEALVYPSPPPTGVASRFAGPAEFITQQAPQSMDGLRSWFVANNVPLPPTVGG